MGVFHLVQLVLLSRTHNLASILRDHGCSGTGQGQGRKDLASAYVLCPLNKQVLIFQKLGAELSQDGGLGRGWS
jgi:hypothetical protein